MAECKCIVEGLGWSTDSEGLGKAFSVYGEIVNSKVISDPETGRSKGIGFVSFREETAMLDAINGMNGQELDGRIITVKQAQSRDNN